jgi:hypothetical protein
MKYNDKKDEPKDKPENSEQPESDVEPLDGEDGPPVPPPDVPPGDVPSPGRGGG